MKILIYIALLVLPLLTWSQVSVSFSGQDNFFGDSIRNVKHSSIKPLSRIDFQKFSSLTNNRKKMNLFVGPSIEVYQKQDFRTKLGLHTVLDGVFSEKFYYRLDVLGAYNKGLQEIYKSELQNYSFLENKESEFLGLDIRGRFSYTPNEVFNFQIGIDNNFIGEGDRSLLLDDHGNPYPFGQIRTRFWNIEFMNLFQFLSDDLNGSRVDKFAATHYLSWEIGAGFNLGVFESVVFRPKDVPLLRGFELDYLNPIQFYRPTEYYLGSSDNVLLGVNLSSTIGDNVIYSQLILDELSLVELRARTRWWGSKYGVQIGFKGHVKDEVKTIYYLTELNVVRPFTYTQVYAALNYGHNNQTLAHPLGANFLEVYGKIGISKNNIRLEMEYQLGVKGGEDSQQGLSFGEDIYDSYNDRPTEYGFFIGANGANHFYKLNLELAYTPVKMKSFELFSKVGVHIERVNRNSEVSPLLYGGLRFSLRKNSVGSF